MINRLKKDKNLLLQTSLLQKLDYYRLLKFEEKLKVYNWKMIHYANTNQRWIAVPILISGKVDLGINDSFKIEGHVIIIIQSSIHEEDIAISNMYAVLNYVYILYTDKCLPIHMCVHMYYFIYIYKRTSIYYYKIFYILVYNN